MIGTTGIVLCLRCMTDLVIITAKAKRELKLKVVA